MPIFGCLASKTVKTLIVVYVQDNVKPHRYHAMDLDSIDSKWTDGCWLKLANPTSSQDKVNEIKYDDMGCKSFYIIDVF